MTNTQRQQSVEAGMRKVARHPSIVALALVVGAGPFSTDTYIAALPQIQRAFDSSASGAQLTITFCIVGLAVGMLFSGPVSDNRGRRPLLIGSAVAYVVASFACAVAPSLVLLLALRLIQGMAAGASASVGRAVVADCYVGVERAKKYGTLGAITLVGPVIAPVVGGVILQVGDWRAVFLFMGLLGLAILALTVFALGETAPNISGASGSLGRMGRSMASMIRRPAFLVPLIVQCLTTGGFFIYIGGSSFVLESQLRVSPNLYSIVFASNALAMVVFSVVFARTVARFGPVRLQRAGVGISLAGMLALVVIAVAAGPALSLGLVWPCLTLLVAGMGLTQSASTVLAQDAGSDASGAAASLLSGCAFLVGSCTTPLTGVLGGQVLSMAVAIAVFLALAMATLVVTAGRVRPGSPARSRG